MFLQELSTKKQRLIQIVKILRENHQFDLPMDSSHELLNLQEQFNAVQKQIQDNSAFNSYHTDPLYAKAVLITEAVRLLFEITPRRRKKNSVKESTNQQEPSMTQLSEKAGKKAKPDFLDVDKDGNKKEPFKKALKDKARSNLKEFEETIPSDEAFDQLKAAGAQNVRTTTDSITFVCKTGKHEVPHYNSPDGGRFVKIKDLDKAMNSIRGLQEKWGTEMKTAPKDVGKWSDYTVAELKARKNKLMDKDERTEKEQKEVRQINFAIRAKQENRFGKIKESQVDEATAEDELEMDRAKADYFKRGGTVKVGNTRVGKGSKFHRPGSGHLGRTGSSQADMPGVKATSIKQKLREDDALDKAETLLAAKDLSDRLQNMAEDAAKMAVDRLMPLVDTMKSQFGQPAAEGFNEVVKAQLQTVLDTIIAAKDQTDNAILAMQGGETPSLGTDMATDMPAQEPLGGEEGASELPVAPEGEDEFAATPSSSGPEEEPMGRARKEPMAESHHKCRECGDGVMENKGKRMVCNECGYAMIAEKLTKQMTSGEIISDFVKSDDPKFRGKSKAERTKMALGAYYGMHPEKSNKEESALAEQTKIVKELVNKYKKLQESFAAHKREFANNPNRIDPLNLGYGLEGDSIRIKLSSVRRELDESITAADEIRQTIQEQNEFRQQTAAKIVKLNEQAQSQTFGVLAVTKNNRKVKKFFENAQHRSMWLDFNKIQITEHRLIDPEDIANATHKLRRTLSK